MPVLWQSSQRPMYVRTVWVGSFRHAILTNDDPYLLKLKRRRPISSSSCNTNKSKSSRLSQRTDDQENLRTLNLIVTSKSRINNRPNTSHAEVERLNLIDLEQDSEDESLQTTNEGTLTESSRSSSCNFDFNMRHIRANKTTRVDVKVNTDLSERVLQWLDLAGKVDLLAPNNAERMTQPRHSWPELQRRQNLTKSKTNDLRKDGGRTTPKGGDSLKAQQNGIIDRHDFFVPTSANTIENYARQSRNPKVTPRHDTNVTQIKENKTKSRELRTKVDETRQKVLTEKCAVKKQYADMISKKLIPDVSKNPKRQVHIFMPELPKKLESISTSRNDSLLSTSTLKLLHNKL